MISSSRFKMSHGTKQTALILRKARQMSHLFFMMNKLIIHVKSRIFTEYSLYSVDKTNRVGIIKSKPLHQGI